MEHPEVDSYHGHVDGAHPQRLETEDGAVLVALPPLQHHQQFIAILLKVMRVLNKQTNKKD